MKGAKSRQPEVHREREGSWPWRPVPIACLGDVEAEAASTEAYRTRRSAGGRLVSVDYAWAGSRTHQTRLIRECRGILFDGRNGQVAARPLHKFFNLGERPEDDAAVDWSQPHTVAAKLDGSLLYPAVDADGTVHWCTRGGVTEKSQEALSLLGPEAAAAEATLLQHAGEAITPSFEYVGPGNRVVVRYGEARMVLVAARRIRDGSYLPPEALAEAAVRWGEALGRRPEVAEGAVVRTGGWANDESRETGIAWVRAMQEGEGVVVAFDNGYRVKVKAERYVKIHRVVSGLGYESHVLQGVLAGDADDWMGTLPEEDARAVRAYAEAVDAEIARAAGAMAGEIARLRSMHPDRKGFAQDWVAWTRSDPVVRSAGFDLYGGKGADPAEVLRRHVGLRSRRATRIEQELGSGERLRLPRWTPRGPEAP